MIEALFFTAVGGVIGAFVTGWLAHKKPDLFVKAEAGVSKVVNEFDDKVNELIKKQATSVEQKVANAASQAAATVSSAVQGTVAATSTPSANT